MRASNRLTPKDVRGFFIWWLRSAESTRCEQCIAARHRRFVWPASSYHGSCRHRQRRIWCTGFRSASPDRRDTSLRRHDTDASLRHDGVGAAAASDAIFIQSIVYKHLWRTKARNHWVWLFWCVRAAKYNIWIRRSIEARAATTAARYKCVRVCPAWLGVWTEQHHDVILWTTACSNATLDVRRFWLGYAGAPGHHARLSNCSIHAVS